jgi:hypothetical protein
LSDESHRHACAPTVGEYLNLVLRQKLYDRRVIQKAPELITLLALMLLYIVLVSIPTLTQWSNVIVTLTTQRFS